MKAQDHSSMYSGVRAILVVLFVALFGALPALAQDRAPSSGTTAQADATLIGPTTEWQVCNETSFVLRTASAFLRGGRMATKGWDEILPGACLTLITPIDSPRFLFAESLGLHQGGVREWKGDTPLCVDSDDFTSDATIDCRLANLVTRDYFAVRPGEPVTTLIEPEKFGPDRAVIAATQRLLRDAGYDITRIDGRIGRKTSRILRTFRQEAELAANAEGEPLLRALMQAARNAKDSVGLEVCNESSRTIWAAIATQSDGIWRSRGWWQAEPDSCVRPLDVPLPGTNAHVFALQDGVDDKPDRRLRNVADTGTQFCIAESRFDALGNEFCADQGYGIGEFRAVPTDAPGARMRLSDSDFADPAPLGLRR
jgi:uncharacterized membrane protein